MTTTTDDTLSVAEWAAQFPPDPPLIERPTDTDQEKKPMTTPHPMRPTADIRRRLLAGEPLTSAQIAEEYGTESSLLGNVIRELKGQGHTVTDEPIPGLGNPKRYSVAMENPDTSAWGKSEDVVSMRANSPRRKVKNKTKDPAALAAPVTARKSRGLPHPVPTLGADLTVNGLTLTADGAVAVSIKNGDGQWLCEVMAYAKAKPQEDG